VATVRQPSPDGAAPRLLRFYVREVGWRFALEPGGQLRGRVNVSVVHGRLPDDGE
jgi:hypothetical protein